MAGSPDIEGYKVSLKQTNELRRGRVVKEVTTVAKGKQGGN